MKGLIVFGILAFLVAALFISGDSLTTTADTSIPDNEITNCTNQTDSPLSATLTITMITPPLPEE